ncbi:Fic family protein [Cytophagaceae bacterium DM2B3-1]|uniref:Fic family protein n=2 Tax=Xanthocytophaga flava TaxID=3048013 RepID=A0ABT7CMP4_9BACT|nr:Fic family protein [Xanthocytophaga flavus]
MQKFRLDWNYHSNAIEGNSLDYGETVAFLMHGLTAKGKPFKDHLDIRGHNDAINFLLHLVKDKRDITETDIRGLHSMILIEPYEVDTISESGLSSKKRIKLGEYKSTPNHVRTITGEVHYYASPEETPMKMHNLMTWLYETQKDPSVHPIVLAALFHHKFVEIHPFDDGNGRLSRLLMNLIIMREQYPPVVIKQDKISRDKYYLALSKADVGDLTPFVEFISQEALNSLEIYLKGARGESMDEPDDLDKELILFKRELEGRKDKIEIKRSIEAQTDIFKTSMLPLVEQLGITLTKFKDFFLSFNKEFIHPSGVVGYYIDYDQGADNTHNAPFEDELSSSLNFSTLIIVFKLNEFKVATNPFGLEVKCFFKFDDFKYRVLYSISEIDELKNINISNYYEKTRETLVTNMYHKHLSTYEIIDICNKIGKKTLEYMKILDENPKFFVLDISQTLLLNVWKEFIDTNVPDDLDKEILKTEVELHFVREKIILFGLLSLSKNMKHTRAILIPYCRDFIIYLAIKLDIKRNIGYSIDLDELPF